MTIKVLVGAQAQEAITRSNEIAQRNPEARKKAVHGAATLLHTGDSRKRLARSSSARKGAEAPRSPEQIASAREHEMREREHAADRKMREAQNMQAEMERKERELRAMEARLALQATDGDEQT